MPRGRGKKEKKNPFDDLDSVYKESVESASDEEIRKKIYEAAMAEAHNQESKKLDQDLASAVATAKEAGRQYAEGSKRNSLCIRYCRSILSARGKL
jgi:hypothetical protein